jgi:NADPH2:quinone reductase
MQIIKVDRFGPPGVLVPCQAPDPVPGPGQVVIRAAAADVLFLDTMLRSGAAQQFFALRPPYVPGNGVSGWVAATGDGVDPSWAGRPVIAHTGEQGGTGGYAEQAAVPAEALIPVPDGVDVTEAAALLHDGATAVALLETVTVKPGDWVLVTAAAGGMGVLLIQLARAAGGRVVGAARGERKLAVARAAGAEAVADYSEPDWASQVRELTDGHGADVVFDGGGGALGRAAFAAVADGGRFSAHGTSDGGFAQVGEAQARSRGVRLSGIPPYAPEVFRRHGATALAETAAGRIRPVIGQRFPLASASAAHAALENRTAVGKTLLLP